MCKNGFKNSYRDIYELKRLEINKQIEDWEPYTDTIDTLYNNIEKACKQYRTFEKYSFNSSTSDNPVFNTKVYVSFINKSWDRVSGVKDIINPDKLQLSLKKNKLTDDNIHIFVNNILKHNIDFMPNIWDFSIESLKKINNIKKLKQLVVIDYSNIDIVDKYIELFELVELDEKHISKLITALIKNKSDMLHKYKKLLQHIVFNEDDIKEIITINDMNDVINFINYYKTICDANLFEHFINEPKECAELNKRIKDVKFTMNVPLDFDVNKVTITQSKVYTLGQSNIILHTQLIPYVRFPFEYYKRALPNRPCIYNIYESIITIKINKKEFSGSLEYINILLHINESKYPYIPIIHKLMSEYYTMIKFMEILENMKEYGWININEQKIDILFY
jgi:hypothetical protein